MKEISNFSIRQTFCAMNFEGKYHLTILPNFYKAKMDYNVIVYWKIHIRPFFFRWCIRNSITASLLLPNLMLHSETSSDRILVYFWIPQRTGSTSFHLYLLPPREMNPFWLGLQKVNLASVFQIFFYGQ